MNALSSEGEEQGNSGSGGLTGGLLSALMCITALLASNRSVLWWNSPSERAVNTDSDLMKNKHWWWACLCRTPSFHVNRGWISRSCRRHMCVKEAFWCRCSRVILVCWGVLNPAGGTKGFSSQIPDILQMTRAILKLFKTLKHSRYVLKYPLDIQIKNVISFRITSPTVCWEETC